MTTLSHISTRRACRLMVSLILTGSAGLFLMASLSPLAAQDKEAKTAQATESEGEDQEIGITIKGVSEFQLLKDYIVPEVRYRRENIENISQSLMKTCAQLYPDRKKIEIVLGKLEHAKPVTLKLERSSLLEILADVCTRAGLKMDLQPSSSDSAPIRIVLASEFDSSNPLITKVIELYPGFAFDLPDRLGASGLDSEPGPVDEPHTPAYRMTQLLTSRGIGFPKGSVLTVAGKFLIVRNSQSNFELIEATITPISDYSPLVVTVRAELYSMPKLDALELLDLEATTVDNWGALEDVRDLVREGKATLLATPSLQTKTATRAKTYTGKERGYLRGFEVKEGKEEPVMESVFLGTELEIDPLIGNDGETIDLTFALSHTLGDPQFVKRKVIAPLSGKEYEAEKVIVEQARLLTAITLISGQSRLVGSLTPTDKDSDSTILVFLKAIVVPIR